MRPFRPGARLASGSVARLAACLPLCLSAFMSLLPSAGAASPPVTPAAAALASRVLAAADSAGRPFAIVDKQAARLMLFHADGSLAGSSPALLGRDRGDHSMPGVGERTQTGTLRPGDATTPAGRFESQPGRNLQGEDIVWVDYEAAFAIHRVRPGAAQAGRLRRLATGDAQGKRVSAGCVVVPVAFYERVVRPLMGRGNSVVYVLPDNG